MDLSRTTATSQLNGRQQLPVTTEPVQPPEPPPPPPMVLDTLPAGQFEKTPNEVLKAILSFLPKNNSFSLVNWLLHMLSKEVFFFPLLSELPAVRSQLEDKENIRVIVETMNLRNESELAHYLAKEILCSGSTEQRDAYTLLLKKLAEGGCLTAQLKVETIFNEDDCNYNSDFKLLVEKAQNSSDACCCVGLRFIGPKDIETLQDFKAAKMWFEKAIALDPTNIAAYIHLGNLRAGAANVRRYCQSETALLNLKYYKDLDEARGHYLTAIELGSVSALYHISFTHMLKFPNSWEIQFAIEYCQQASDKGYAKASNKLIELARHICLDYETYGEILNGISEYIFGLIHLNGWHVDLDIPKGVNYLITAVEKGHENALFQLSNWYIAQKKSLTPHSAATTECFEFVIKHLKQSKHSDALYTLGTMYEVGLSVSSQKEAASSFEQAVIRDRHKKAAEKAGPDMLWQAMEHIKKGEYKNAYAIYAPLAETGNAEAKHRIVFMVMEKWISKIDDNLFVLCFKYVANQGNATAAFELAERYMTVNYFQRNPQEAIKWYEKAHALWHPNAAYKLGCLYMDISIIKTRAEILKAKEWFEKAMAGGDKEAPKQLAAASELLKSKWLK